jgi:hypothetical protein
MAEQFIAIVAHNWPNSCFESSGSSNQMDGQQERERCGQGLSPTPASSVDIGKSWPE